MTVEVTITETFEKVVRLWMPQEVENFEQAQAYVMTRVNLANLGGDDKTFDATSTVGTSDGGDCDWKRDIKIRRI